MGIVKCWWARLEMNLTGKNDGRLYVDVCLI